MKTLAILFSLTSSAALAGISSGGGFLTDSGSGVGEPLNISTLVLDSIQFDTETARLFDRNIEVKALQDFQTSDGQRAVITQDEKGNWQLILEKLEN